MQLTDPPETRRRDSPAPRRRASTSLRVRRLTGLVVLVGLLLVGLVLSIALGAREIPLGTVLDSLGSIRAAMADPASADPDLRVIAELRVPRTLIALVVGAALGVAGALIQGHTRNPLADPGILGVSSGAALAVVGSFALFGVTGAVATSVWAFGGAVVATALVFALASIGNGQVNPLTLILGGAALSAVLGSVTSSLVLTDDNNLDRMRFWTVGSVAGRDLTVFWGVLPFIVVGLVLALATGPQLNLLNLGDDVASALGVDTGRARVGGMLLISLLAGAATAAAGPVGFIGLVVPHIVRAVTGPDYRWILPYSALAGSVLILFADVVGRVIARPGELQVGIVLAFVGAPFFIVLISRRKVVSI
ncbi:FecCD family ABC transporter permease [Corynebacterium bovis]|uniref:Iron ABC transporter permease n=2 Tax=Corynebacterium bovis TaxID=36808 RepID=A0A3R8RJV7_9CORY|nr:iron ABC transporter permease [Corynebacterium bovis]MBB3116681.1 iron complex transport system permease protein [Corynebacterium bovis DSM 20582 = CIP 54.80]MDN8579543.1 iron ABC transporter permease [Corynebacterium bovis]RRO79108.1 iron ABC transporter permease [Corynebacterium bovis]RRO80010.1 iron ABC transporter permease [Corynebacterium bovis]RRO82243.1 iron ABC transporter permease [Corynebacterium bovis]